MTVAIDPVISNVFFTLGLIPHISRKKEGYYTPHTENLPDHPLVTVLIPLYQEPLDTIMNLVSCLKNQTYDHGKLELIFITEPDDSVTGGHVEEIVSDIKDGFAAVTHLVTDGEMKMKPYALNWGLARSRGSIIGIYDAECEPENGQVAKAVCSIHERDYDLVQTKIEVVSSNTLGEFCKLDIYSWTENILPFIREKTRAFPLGTKGLFLKRECLEGIGGFPLHLTEDAMMTILLAERDTNFGLLDSVTKEKAVRTLRTHFKQRRRWFRGYLSCLFKLPKARIPLKRKLWLSIPYISPVLCTATLFGFIFLSLYFITWYFKPGMTYVTPWMENVFYDRVLFYWSLFLGYVGLPVSLFSYLYSIADKTIEDRVMYVYLTPFYWLFVGITALSSFFKNTDNWDKTTRE